ncbi:MAG: quinone-interacting membrane-bound oxidoreductase complex subunit QmoC [Planctomycetota bacterium]
MEAADVTSQERGADAQESHGAPPAPSGNGTPVRIDPDLEFIRLLRKRAGPSLKKCFQCGTCSTACTISPDLEPFPRKEMAWAVWGMRNRLLTDPDVWLCHQCNDCSTRCPRGARPGDVLAAVRQESVLHYAFPRFLGRWVNQPQLVPFLLAIPAILLTLALLARDPVAEALGLTRQAEERIVYSYSHMFPHWLLNSFFFLFSGLALIAVLVGVARFWSALKVAGARNGLTNGSKGVGASIGSALKSVFAHGDFTMCTTARPRFASHLCVFFGFLALSLVTIWVITAKHNPLIRSDFIYPFGLWNPWKILANAGGAAVTIGCLLMIYERLKDREHFSSGTYFDWALLGTLLLVVLSGFATEVLHFQRLEPHRHIVYFAHLVFVFALLIYLPYSKLAHIFYRFTAMVYAEYSGRTGEAPARSGQLAESEGGRRGGDEQAPE